MTAAPPITAGVIEARLAILRSLFLNRTDVLAGLSPHTCKPCPITVAEGKLDELLRAHLDGSEITARYKTGSTHGRVRIGSYAPATDGTTRWGCLDIDGPEHANGLADPDAALRFVLRRAAELGLPLHVERSRRGYHCWLLLDAPAPAQLVRDLLRALCPTDALLAKPKNGVLVADAERGVGLELFPKQAAIAADGLGNMVWLPWHAAAEAPVNRFARATNSVLEWIGDDEIPEPFTTVTGLQVEAALSAAGAWEESDQTRRTVATDSMWRSWREQALARLDLHAVYGDVLTGKGQGRGWLEARDPWSPSGDRNPSAGVATGEGKQERGTWHSFVSSETFSVFDFLEKTGRAANFDAAVKLVAEWTGVPMPSNGKAKARTSPRAGSATTKPAILVPGEHDGQRVGIDEFVDAVLAALPAGALYLRDYVVGELIGNRGEMKFAEVSEHRARCIIDQHVQLERMVWTEKDKCWNVRFVACTRDLAAAFLATAPTRNGLRRLRTIINYPVFGRDFALVAPGWNDADGIYYDEPADLEGLQPNATGALDVLDDLLVDFPFRDDASRENAFGMMLTPILAHAIRGNIPFHLVLASLERTGKGLLIDTCLGIVVLGTNAAPVLQIGRTEEEREKRITSAIIDGTTVVHLDNLPTEDVLDSESLASLATSRVWRGRVLGHSRIVHLPNSLIPVMSGNNPKASGELTKRTVPIVLQPLDDHPEERQGFAHPDIRRYARERRRVVLEALLGLVVAWREAGRPEPQAVRMGGFEAWARTVGGVLHHAGATGWMENYRGWVRAGDDFAADAAVLVDLWRRKHGEREVTASQVLDMVREAGVFTNLFVGPDSGVLVRLARRVLSKLKNRPVGAHLVYSREHGSNSRYWLGSAVP